MNTIHTSKELQKIVGFLNEIGIQLVEKELPDDCFLPGLSIEGTTIFMDPDRMKYPGDILHEAGHIAVTASDIRPFIGTDKMDTTWPSDGEEIVTLLWSYAALKHLKLDPSFVFHPNGYKNQADWLIEQFESGSYIGIPLLEWMGLCYSEEKNGVPPFPHMLKWMR